MMLPTRAAEQTFVNPNLIVLYDQTNAVPYPSTISVTGLVEVADKVTVTISGVTHPNPQDLDLLLIGPRGQAVLLLSDAGAPAHPNDATAVTNATLRFDDDAPVALRQFGQINSGTYQPSDYPPADIFPLNVPPGPYSTNLSVFHETDPNGSWQLYVVDDGLGGSGTIGGWSLTIRTHSQVFRTANSIVVSNTAALGSPYPSVLSVSNVVGPITKVTVTLSELSHTYPSDLDILLVGPSSNAVVLMSDVGANFPASKITLNFDDAAMATLPINSALLSGSFQPTNYLAGDVFPKPAPGNNYGSALSVFNGESANGNWQLFVVDDFPGADGGQIAGGWKLAISTEPLAITQQPTNQSITPGSNATLFVSVAGIEPITYQWRLNDAAIPGATNRVLNLLPFAATNAGSYSVTVVNASGRVESEKVRLLPTISLMPASDAFNTPQVLTGTNGTVMSTNFFATKEVDEPWHAGKLGGGSVWYSWTPPTGGIATLDTGGSAFDTLLAVYTGGTLNNLTRVAYDDDSAGFYTSTATFNVSANQTYHIAVDGITGYSGTFLLNWRLESTFDDLPEFADSFAGLTVTEGTNVTLSFPTSAPAGTTYQWSRNGVAIPGATTSALDLFNVQSVDVGTYVLSGRTPASRFAWSKPIVLEIGQQPEIQSRSKIKDVKYFSTALFSAVTASSMTSRRPTDESPFESPGDTGGGIVSTSGPPFLPTSAGAAGYQIINNSGGTSSSALCAVDDLGAAFEQGRYLGFAPTQDGEFLIDTAGSAIAARLEAYVLDDGGLEHSLDCSQGFPCALRFAATNGGSYIVAADSTNIAITGSIRLNWNFGAHLSIKGTGPTQAELSWYASSDAYEIEFTPSLFPTTWSLMSPQPHVDSNNRTNTAMVRIYQPSPSGLTNQYFRLHLKEP